MNRVNIGADPKFKELLNEIKIERIKNGKDKEILSDKRLTLAIARVDNLKNILLQADITKELNRRGYK